MASAVELISRDPRLQLAARYCRVFRVDVVGVLRSDTELNRMVRAAALQVVDRDERAAEAKAKHSGASRGRRGRRR